MTWFKVDDKLCTHPKVRAAGLAAMGLWVVCGSWAAAHQTDGFVPSWFVGQHPNGHRSARRLVAAGLWIKVDKPSQPCGQPVDNLWTSDRTESRLVSSPVSSPVSTVDNSAGYRFHDWELYQPEKPQVRGGKEGGLREPRPRGTRAPAPARAPSSPEGTDGVLRESQSSNVTRGPVDNFGLDHLRIMGALRAASGRPVSDDHTRAVIADVLGRTGSSPPRDPTAYVLAAIKREPQRYAPTPGPAPFRLVVGGS